MEDKHTGHPANSPNISVTTQVHNRAMTSQTLTTDVSAQCLASTSCDGPQPSAILSTDLSELTSKFESENLIKVDTMLAEPCQYLEEVSVFGVADEGETNHHDYVDGSVELHEAGPLFKAEEPDQTEKTLGHPTNINDGTLKEDSLLGDGSSKDAKVNILDSAPFLMSDSGVIFQCFPISEKEVFLVSLEDETLLMNESLTEEHLPVVTETTTDMEMGSFEEAKGEHNENLVDGKLEDSQFPSIESTSQLGSGASECSDIPSTSLMTSSQSNFEENNDFQDSELSAEVSSREMTVESVDHIGTTLSVSTNTDDTGITTRKKRKALSALKDDEHGQLDPKITHATIYATAPRRIRKWPAESEEVLSELYKCTVCNETLPTSGTLRHHLVFKHNQSNIDSFTCFLCKQECWSVSQQEWHLRIQHGIKNKSLACLVCGTQFSTPTECRAHIRKHPLNLACPSCPKKFASQYQLVQHVKQHLEVIQPFSCQVCENRFTSTRTLETHMWRHRFQNCPEEPCDYAAEDESWLLRHLQDQHKYTTQSVRSLIASRNSAEYKMDILLSKYVQTQAGKIKSVPSNTSEACDSQDQSTSVRETLRNEHDSSVTIGKDATELDNQALVDAPSVVLKDMMEAVIAVEEDDKKAIRREEEILRKVFDGGTSQHRCGLCNSYHASLEDLAAHKLEHNQIMECIKCQKSFSSVKQLKRHMTAHTTIKDVQQNQLEKDKDLDVHQCLVCGKEYGSESALSRHSSVHMRSEGRHQCKVCSRRVRTRAHLTEHMSRVHKIHCDSKRIQCPMCDRRFVSNSYLNSHLITHGEIEPLYTCKICNRNYLRPRSLQRHMISHDQTYSCRTCNESFPSARRLALHVRGHDPSYKSKIHCPHCSVTFSFKSQLEIHLRIHTGEKPFVCETCGKCFKRLQQCKAHHKAVHGSEKHLCLECGKPFGDKTNLLRHRLKIHYHLKRWVCGVCAQTFGYSRDFRNHLQKQHNIEFHLDISNKKCMSEVYVVPELGTREINPSTRTAIEYYCEMERQKVKQILSGTIPDVEHTEKAGISSAGDTNDPDDPAPVSENVVYSRSVLLPSVPVDVSNVVGSRQLQLGIQSGQNIQPLTNGEVQGLVPLQVAGVKCVECGIDATVPQQCGVCGVMVCSQAHMDIHSASVHQVLFQCSVCGLHYSSQSECVAHVLSTHSSCLAYQGTSATYLQPGQIFQSNSLSAPTQLCLPPVHSQTNSQCILQVAGGSSQLPVVVTPSAVNVPSQPFASAGYLLQYCNFVSGVPAGISVTQQAAALEPVSNIGKQTVYSVSNVITNQQSSTKQTQSCGALMIKKPEPNLSTSLCSVTIPGKGTGDISVSSESGSILTFSAKPTADIRPAFTSHADNTSEVSSIVVGSEEFQKQDHSTSVLLVDSEPVPDLSDEDASVMPSQRLNSKINVGQQTSSSIANALLTLAEAPQEDQPSVLVENAIPEGEADQVLSFSLVADVPFMQEKKDAISSGENSGVLQTISEISSLIKKEEIQEPLLSSPEDLQMMDSSTDAKPPQEISVEIIQPQVMKARSDSKSLKTSPKKCVTRVRRKRITNLVKIELYECKACSKSFSSNAQLEKHQATHGIRRFKCQVCSKAFSEKYNLKIHTLTHTQERPHECNLCQKSFRYARDLTEHKRTHEGSRPHACDVCNKAFVRKRDFIRHQAEQHNNKGFQCKVCGLYFKRQHYLKEIHMRHHHPLLIEACEEGKTKGNESPKIKKQNHICKICGKTFARARYLTSHLRIHSKRADYVRCPKCPRMFISEKTLKVHKQAFHDHEHGLQDNSSTVVDCEHIITQDDGIATHFDQSQTENLVISEVQDLTEGPRTSLASSAQACTSQVHPKSKLEILSSVNSPTSVQSTYSNVLVRSDLVLEGSSIQSARMGHFNVHIDNVESVNYFSPSFSS